MPRSRRTFLRQSAIAAAGISAGGLMPTYLQARTVSPNDKIRIGVIGCNGMGWSNMRSLLNLPEVDCVALADVDQRVLDRRSGDVQERRGMKPKLYKDYRRLLEDDSIDAVVIGTPDHWHCLITCDALAAGKHVYCEKPLANSIEECRVMMAAAKNSGKLVQVGQWQRSGTHYAQAIELVRSGRLGNIRLVKTWAYQGWMKPVPVQPNEPAPEAVDYDMWLGPAPDRPFNPNRFHFNFRWFWDYAGGLMTDWGVHEIDIALYAMNAKAPKSVMASGGKLAYPDDASETPDTLQTVYEYDGFNMLWEHATGIDGGNYGRTEGIAFIGNNGTLVVNRGGWEIIPEKEYNEEAGMWVNKIEDYPDHGRQGDYLDMHTRNFVEAMQKNDASHLNCSIDSGAVAAINAHMGNIAYKLGRKIYWDNAAGRFKDAPDANEMLSVDYHNGWKLPKV